LEQQQRYDCRYKDISRYCNTNEIIIATTLFHDEEKIIWLVLNSLAAKITAVLSMIQLTDSKLKIIK